MAKMIIDTENIGTVTLYKDEVSTFNEYTSMLNVVNHREGTADHFVTFNTFDLSKAKTTVIANGTTLNVRIYSLSSFTQKQCEDLASYADMVSQSDIESKLILYPTSINQIFNDWNDEKEESDIDEELAKFCKDIHNELVDQYIFD